MKSKIFNTHDIRAILDGRKSQFREVVKDSNLVYWNSIVVNGYGGYVNEHGSPRPPKFMEGDLIYCRETWRRYMNMEANDGEVVELKRDGWELLYMFDGDGFQMYNKDGSERFIPWKSPASMPSDAAQIFLEVTDVKAERIRDLSEEDAVSEGVHERSHRCGGFGVYESGGEICDCECQEFEFSPIIHGYIDGLNHKNKGSWERNDWVFAYSFKRLEKPEGFGK